ncbi:MAG: helix-turn-helix transcriptional regulator [Eubacteriales bacterium]
MKAYCCEKNQDIKENSLPPVITENDSRIQIISHQVFLGIKLVYNNIHIQSLEPVENADGNVLEICHCREGRMEFHLRDEFCYITPGDIFIVRAGDIKGASYFPIGHYHGISVLIDIDRTPKCLSCFLDDVNVEPKSLAEKFCKAKQCFIARSNPSFEHIFSEIYSVDEKIRTGYLKIKTLELLLFLSAMDLRQDEYNTRVVSDTQVTLAKEISGYLTGHMDDRITLEQLSDCFHISGTQIKTAFKAVYGVSFYSYIRALKMESAAYMLEYTDKTILEISGEHGYDNGSKFANAFKTVKGMTPTEYRSRKKNKRFCPNGA